MSAKPLDRVEQSIAKFHERNVAEFGGRFRDVHAVTTIVALSVLNLVHSRPVGSRRVEQHLREFFIGQFRAATDVVDLARATLDESQRNSTTVIVDVEPVSNIESVTVERHTEAIDEVGHEQRNNLFWELVCSVVVRAARCDRVESVSLVVRPNDEVASRFARRIGGIGKERLIFIPGTAVD